MKLVFLCTSLAPGRDGVGDYVRQLAAACTQQGHVCLLVAVHDRDMAASAPILPRAGEVRLPSTLSWARRAEMLRSLLREFEPHWVSWQIVPFGFDPKGLLPAGAFALADAARGWRNHVLLHELWVGLARGERLRLRVLGALQRRKLLAFLVRLAPACVHTTNPSYQFALAHSGWPADLLPLFGNMPVLPIAPAEAARVLQDILGPALPPAPRWLGVIFGTIHPQWRPEPTLKWLQAAGAAGGRSIGLLIVGRMGAHGTQLLKRLGAAPHGVSLLTAGPQPAERISHLLQATDFGLATHPWALIDKSGTTATLLEHGLPVLVPRDDWTSRYGGLGAPTDPLLCRLQDLAPTDFSRWLTQRRPPAARLPAIAAEFIASLQQPQPGGALVA